MAFTITPKNIGTGFRIGSETDLSTTAVENACIGPCKLAKVTIKGDGAGNLKLIDTVGQDFTAGSNDVDYIIPFIASTTLVYVFDPPLEFKEGFTYFAATEDGDDTGTDPTGTPEAEFLFPETI